MNTTHTATIGASLETMLHTGQIHSFADMCRVAASLVALDNMISVDVDAPPVSGVAPTMVAATVRPSR